MADTMHRQGEEQQLVYRIDCDEHSTIGGAPLVLVLQKESAKPILLILFGTQTYPSRTPVIKDQRRNKGQGYILQDERKPPPISPASHPIRSTQTKHPSFSTLPYSFWNCDPYQQQSMYHQQHPTDPSQGTSSFGQLSYDMSYNNQIMPWGQQQQQMFTGSRNRTYPPFQPPPLHNNQPYALSNEDGMAYGRMGSTMEIPSTPFCSHYHSKRIMMMPMQQDNNVPYAPWTQYDQQVTPTMQSNPIHRTPTSAVPPPPPAFRMMNGPRRSKSVSFAPLPDHIVV